MMIKLLRLTGLARKAGKVEIGEAKILTAARSGKTRLLIVASDVSPRTLKNAKLLAEESNFGLLIVECTKAELGQSLGFASCAVAAITDSGFAKAIKKAVTEA